MTKQQKSYMSLLFWIYFEAGYPLEALLFQFHPFYVTWIFVSIPYCMLPLKSFKESLQYDEAFSPSKMFTIATLGKVNVTVIPSTITCWHPINGFTRVHWQGADQVCLESALRSPPYIIDALTIDLLTNDALRNPETITPNLIIWTTKW